MSLINISQNDLPLCPNSSASPGNPAHQLHNRIIDAVYDATPKNEDGEPATPELEAVSLAVSYGRVSDRMRLYQETAGGMSGGRYISVEAWYFRCDVCGLILPANRMPEMVR